MLQWLCCVGFPMLSSCWVSCLDMSVWNVTFALFRSHRVNESWWFRKGHVRVGRSTTCVQFSAKMKRVCSSLSLYFLSVGTTYHFDYEISFFLLCWVCVWRMAKGNGFQSRTCVHFSTTQRLLAMYQKYNHICRNELEAVHHAAGRSEHGSVDSVRRTSQPSFYFYGMQTFSHVDNRKSAHHIR